MSSGERVSKMEPAAKYYGWNASTPSPSGNGPAGSLRSLRLADVHLTRRPARAPWGAEGRRLRCLTTPTGSIVVPRALDIPLTMAATLALVAALFFALAATLQQKGALNLPTVSLAQPSSLLRLVGQTMWLLGTVALFVGYLFQAAALDRGRLSVIQPLLVTTVVFALPLGYFLTNQHVGRREVIGAVVIIVGLGLFVYFGDPAGGKENASNIQWAITIGLLVLLSVLLLAFGSSDGLSMKAAVYGTVAGIGSGFRRH